MFKKLLDVKKNGFTIIEVLLSILILSIGLAAYNFLQLTGVNNTFVAYKEKSAIQSLNDYTDYFKHLYVSTKNEQDKDFIKDILSNNSNWNQSDSCSVLIVNNEFDCLIEDSYSDRQLCDIEKKLKYQIHSLQCDIQKMINNSKTNLVSCSSGSNNYCLYTYWESNNLSYSECKSFNNQCVFLEFKL